MAEGNRQRKRRSGKETRIAEGVYRLPSGNIRLRWYAGTVGGKEKTDTVTIPGDTPRRDAIKMRADLMKRSAQERTNGGPETIGGYAEHWSKPGWAETTERHNRGQIKPFVRDFGDRRPDTVTRREARLWSAGGVVPGQLEPVARRWAGVEENEDGDLVVPPHRGNVPAVRAMFTAMVDDQIIDQNPFAGLRLKQERGRSDIAVLEPDELDRLEAIARRKAGPVFAAMIRFAAWTGLRPSELYALRWHDIDWDEGIVKVRRQFRSKVQNPSERETAYTKTDAGNRDVELLEPAEEALASLAQPLRPTDLVFTTPEGQQWNARMHTYWWGKVRPAFWETLDEARKCPYCAKGREHTKHERDSISEDFDFYELRHFFGTQAAQLPGATPMDVALAMGHADGGKLAMERYFHIDKRRSRGRLRAGYDRWKAEQQQAERRREAQ